MFLDYCWDCNIKLEKMCQVNLKSHQLNNNSYKMFFFFKLKNFLTLGLAISNNNKKTSNTKVKIMRCLFKPNTSPLGRIIV